MMNYQFIADLENDLRKRFPNYPAEPTLTPDRCPAGMKGDFALNCFRLARFCGGPAAAAEAVASPAKRRSGPYKRRRVRMALLLFPLFFLQFFQRGNAILQILRSFRKP